MTSAGSTKGLHVHLKSKHNINVKELQALCQKKPSTLQQQNMTESESNLKKIKTMDSYFSPIETKEMKMKMMISRITAKDGLPLRVFCVSEDLRLLFQSAGLMLQQIPYPFVI